MENYNFYMINLLQCGDRKTHMYNLYDNDNLKYVEAVDGSWISENDEVSLPPNLDFIKNSAYKINDYEIACTSSHIKAIKIAYENNEKEVFIIEDDTHNTYKSLWKKNLRTIIRNKPEDAECIIFFTSNADLQRKLIETSKEKEFIKFDKSHTSTGIYYINRSGMEKIYNHYVKNDTIVFPVANVRAELLADRKALFSKMKTYHYTTPTFIDECKSSTIHQRHLTIHEKNHNILVNFFIQQEISRELGSDIEIIIKEKKMIMDKALNYIKTYSDTCSNYNENKIKIAIEEYYSKLNYHGRDCTCDECKQVMSKLKKNTRIN